MLDYAQYELLLESKHVKTSEVATATGISASTFSDWKRGKSKPKIDKLQKIADYFNVPLTYFLKEGGEDSE